MEAVHGKALDCTVVNEAQIGDDFCGSGFNSYIEGSEPIVGHLLRIMHDIPSSLATDIHNDEAMAFVGTKNGKIMKIHTELHKSADPYNTLFSMNLSTNNSINEVRPFPAFDSNKKYLYFVSGNQVVKFPAGSCSIYTDCASCLSKQDPLRCGWCGSYCATHEECDRPEKLTSSVCPPEMFDFSPTSGPFEGGTQISIIGENFGKPSSSENSGVFVKVVGTDCEVKEWTQNRVICQTKKIEQTNLGNC